MNDKKFPEGTLFSGEYAFIPLPENLGGGFKTIKISNCDVDVDMLSDNVALNVKSKQEDIKNINDINFDINYDELLTKDSNNIDTAKSYDDSDPFITDDLNKKEEKNIHGGHRQRLRNRYERFGLESFEEHEVLEFLLYFTHERRDTNGYAHALINEFGSLDRVFKTEMHDLQTVEGIGPKSALLINFCRQLITYLNTNIKEKVNLANSTAMGMFCCKYFMQRTEETFIVLMLDTKRTLQKVVVISKGTENETAYYPRNVLKEVIKHKANTVVISHNHTGNSVHPSDNDIYLSNQISKLLSGIGVPLLDHIICCGSLFTSLSDRGLLSV